MKLKSILKTLDLERLKKIEKHWGVQPMVLDPSLTDRQKKSRLIDYLYPRLQISQYFMVVYDRLGMEEKDLLFFLAIHGGDVGEGEVHGRFFQGDRERMDHAIETLMLKGIVFYVKTDKAAIDERLVGVPFDDILARVGDQLYQPSNPGGRFIFYNVGPLSASGKLDVIAVGDSQDAAEQALTVDLAKLLFR